MPNTGMGPSFKLDTDTINRTVPNAVIGAYVLGFQQPNTFSISYVGRSDEDLKQRLISHTNEKYTDFKFIVLPSKEEAFYKECNLYHDWGENTLDNKKHPDRPEGTNYQCPRCNEFNNLSGYYI